MSATLTPAELSEIVPYLRIHPSVRLVETDIGPLVEINGGNGDAMDPRQFLDLIRSSNETV